MTAGRGFLVKPPLVRPSPASLVKRPVYLYTYTRTVQSTFFFFLSFFKQSFLSFSCLSHYTNSCLLKWMHVPDYAFGVELSGILMNNHSHSLKGPFTPITISVLMSTSADDICSFKPRCRLNARAL